MKTADTNWQNLKKVCAHLLEFITTASFHEVNINYVVVIYCTRDFFIANFCRHLTFIQLMM